MIVIAGIVSAGCPPKIVRVEVSKEDLIKADQAFKEGDAAFNRKDYYAALIKYLDATSLNPNDSYFFNRLGIAYSQLQYYEDAIKVFRRSMALDPAYPYAVNNLGTAFFARRQFRKAEKSFKKAISMKENEASFYMNLGALYFEKKRPDKAIIAWRKGLELDADILTKKNAVSLALEGDKESLREKNYFLARLYAAAGNIPKAIECLEIAVDNGFSDIEAIQQQPDFDSIRKDARFVEFMKSAATIIKSR